jgi:hypothetical protein
MSTSSKTHKAARGQAIKAVPTCRWYLAEDVRTELSGKLSLMGVFPTDTVVVEMPRDIPDPTPDEPIALEGLTVLCVLIGFVGVAEFELVMGEKTPSPSSVALTRKLLVESESALTAANLVSRFRPALVRSFGERVFTISCPAIKFKDTFTFKIERRDTSLPPEPAPRISLVPVKAEVPLPTKRAAKRTASKKRPARATK